MIRFREHRGGLAESMATTREFDTPQEVRDHLCYLFGSIMSNKAVSKPYPDDRGWTNVHIITCPVWGVLGFMEGPLEI